MFHEESLVTTVFKIINLGVFIAAAGYLLKKQLIPIRQEIAHKKLERTILEQENNLSDQGLVHAQQSMNEQNKWLQSMEHNIAQWNTYMLAIHQQREQEKEEIRKKVALKVAQQTSYIQMAQARNTIIPYAVVAARDALEKMNVSDQQAYLKKLVEFFKKEVR